MPSLWAAAAAERTEPGPAVCDPECIKFGNCGEDEICRCPFGRLGKNCEIDFLAPCRQFPDGDALCGLASAKSCECIKRCEEYFCLKTTSGSVQCHGLPGPHGHQCYRRLGLPPDQQYSLIPEPEELAAGKVKCYRGFAEDAPEMECKEAMTNRMDVSVPLSKCPDQCNKRGYCARWADNLEGEPFCRCHRGFEGGLCEIDKQQCYLKCNGRGKCRDQYCHCEPPYFSIGCSRSTVYPANYSRPSPVDFKIYMYELSTQLAFENAEFSGWQQHDAIYVAYQQFLEQFLLSSVRTEDPAEANLFYIPSMTFSHSSNVGTGEEHMRLVIDHIRHEYPYWNRTGGRDHFFWLPADRGACHVRSDPLFFDAIKVTHFGMHTVPGHKGPFPHAGHPSYGCHHPLRDVVNVPNWPPDQETYPLTKELTVDQLLEKKKTLFFFAGGQTEDPAYSGGTRQQVSKLVHEWNDTEFDYVKSGVGNEYQHRLRASKYCFAPYGAWCATMRRSPGMRRSAAGRLTTQ
ncbi:exostosin-like glycosyltransferase [Micractinium conductrix]|uniref:Exostosin-like glycosyltransferase n=1 Tax=Micractinium conductrix TaxID=554055 RepID=A0A2P6VM55_9CHLO|nr:exostosin-like glycosyltransferase [Micractinium conductrix]|eukprot:PSC75169.1 exostosin-like glycosyltransferase [Micractinium conductrix]